VKGKNSNKKSQCAHSTVKKSGKEGDIGKNALIDPGQEKKKTRNGMRGKNQNTEGRESPRKKSERFFRTLGEGLW